MDKNKLFAAAGAAVAAGALAVSSLTAASASPSAGQRATGTEYFQIVSGSLAPGQASVIATGAFTAGGADFTGPATDTLRFPGGTFQVTHSARGGTQSFNARTCLATISSRGTLTLGHGTGRYAGIRGHGTYTLSIGEIAARSHGRCSLTTAPVAFQEIVHGHGPVRL